MCGYSQLKVANKIDFTFLVYDFLGQFIKKKKKKKDFLGQ